MAFFSPADIPPCQSIFEIPSRKDARAPEKPCYRNVTPLSTRYHPQGHFIGGYRGYRAVSVVIFKLLKERAPGSLHLQKCINHAV